MYFVGNLKSKTKHKKSEAAKNPEFWASYSWKFCTFYICVNLPAMRPLVRTFPSRIPHWRLTTPKDILTLKYLVRDTTKIRMCELSDPRLHLAYVFPKTKDLPEFWARGGPLSCCTTQRRLPSFNVPCFF